MIFSGCGIFAHFTGKGLELFPELGVGAHCPSLGPFLNPTLSSLFNPSLDPSPLRGEGGCWEVAPLLAKRGGVKHQNGIHVANVIAQILKDRLAKAGVA